MRVCAIIVCLMIMSAGCSSEETGQNIFVERSNKIDSFVRLQNWEKARRETKELKKLYIEARWKLQLIGNEEEYNGIHQAIDKLFISIEGQDKVEARYQISMIKQRSEGIYFY